MMEWVLSPTLLSRWHGNESCLLSCLATISLSASFASSWRPASVSGSVKQAIMSVLPLHSDSSLKGPLFTTFPLKQDKESRCFQWLYYAAVSDKAVFKNTITNPLTWSKTIKSSASPICWSWCVTKMRGLLARYPQMHLSTTKNNEVLEWHILLMLKKTLHEKLLKRTFWSKEQMTWNIFGQGNFQNYCTIDQQKV